MSQETRICKKCSNPINDNATFCGFCGTRFEAAVSYNPVTTNQNVRIEQVANIQNDIKQNVQTLGVKEKMGFFQLLFTNKGRIGRGTFFKGFFLMFVVWGGIATIFFAIFGGLAALFDTATTLGSFFGVILVIGLMICFIGFFWSELCVVAKRYHDFGISYRQAIFMNLNPFYAIKSMFDLPFSEGSGPNQYGEYSQ